MGIKEKLSSSILRLLRGSASQKSLLSLHINFLTEPDRMHRFIAEAKPRAVLSIHHDPVFFKQARADSPETLFIGRYFVDDQRFRGNPEVAAEWLVDHILGRSDPWLFDAWTGFNDVASDDENRWREMGRFDRRAAELLHERDLKYVAGSFGTGHPTRPEFVQLPEIVDAWSIADYLAAHEYLAPRMDDPRGMDPEQPGSGWFIHRHRKWYPSLPPEAQKPLVITETGIDSDACRWDPGAQGGWRSFCSADDYFDQLLGYESVLKEDPYVLAALPFCWGTLDSAWDSFDIKGRVVDLLESHLKKSWTKPSPTPDFPTYHSHYLLLPQQVPEEGWQAIRRYADAFRITLGRSEHDSVLFYGGLSHTISVVQPSEARLLFLRREQKKRGFTLDVIRGSWEEVRMELDWRAKSGERVI